MGQLVKPQVYLLGYTTADENALAAYLEASGNQDFIETWRAALAAGVNPGEAMCSVAAKICYKSLTLGQNANVSRTRDIADNIRSCFDTGHGSVFEHCQLNFVATNVSRIFTHELCRHRAGWAFSQTSGRYCRLESIDLVWDDILDPVKDLFMRHVQKTEEAVYVAECRLGLRKPPDKYGSTYDTDCLHTYDSLRGLERVCDSAGHPAPDVESLRWVPDNSFDFDKRKKLTSAIRRIAPNGQANEIFFSCNIRALRHVVQIRTARFAEREIREVFNQVYQIVKAKFPLIFHGAKESTHEGLLEITGMKQQPYDQISKE